MRHATSLVGDVSLGRSSGRDIAAGYGRGLRAATISFLYTTTLVMMSLVPSNQLQRQ